MPEKAESKQLSIKYEVDYRNVRYPRLEYKTGNLLLILPKDYDKTAILDKHRRWIMHKEQIIKQALETAEERTLNLDRTDEELRQFVNSTIKKIEKETHININKVFFRRMRTKWGSYSSKSNLTINTLLKYLPEELIDYIIFHELAHSQERKHNERFWQIISRKFKDYQTKEKDLLVYWFLVQKMTQPTNKMTTVKT
jgi:predicted metal-dependent hydrolase